MTSASLLSVLGDFGFRSISIESHEKILVSKGDDFSTVVSMSFEGKKIGLLKTDITENEAEVLAAHIAPLAILEREAGLWEFATDLLTWIKGAKNLKPEVCDWIGLYFKESLLDGKNTDLLLGPFLGEPTEHHRIPLYRGLCGLALREEKTVNVADVSKRSEHIACSIKTRSELVIPLKDEEGNFIAELDIDCHKLGAFDPEIEKTFKDYAETFPPWPRSFE